MNLNEMNVVITGANGSVSTVLMDYFSSRAAFVAGTVRQLAENVENYNNSVSQSSNEEIISNVISQKGVYLLKNIYVKTLCRYHFTTCGNLDIAEQLLLFQIYTNNMY